MDYLGKNTTDRSLVDKAYVDDRTSSAVLQYQFPQSSMVAGTLTREAFYLQGGDIISDRQLQDVLKGNARVYHVYGGWTRYMLAHGRYKDENNWMLVLQENSITADTHLEYRAVCVNGTVTCHVDEKLPVVDEFGTGQVINPSEPGEGTIEPENPSQPLDPVIKPGKEEAFTPEN